MTAQFGGSKTSSILPMLMAIYFLVATISLPVMQEMNIFLLARVMTQLPEIKEMIHLMEEKDMILIYSRRETAMTQ